jgi:xanthine dehydrogenase YagR molybdenum-binding subunit
MSAPSAELGKPITRVDGIAKVTGAARFASDEPVNDPLFAYFITSHIARGSIQSFDLSEARRVPGVIDIVTYENVGSGFDKPQGPDGGATTTTLEDNHIWHAGQIIGIVVAETYEAAREAANRAKVRYDEETPSATFDSPGISSAAHKPGPSPDPEKGDAETAYAKAPIKFEAHYATPAQHHNPIELFTTTCEWRDGKLTIYEPSQFMWGTKASVARQLKLDPDQVRAISRYVGGAFGSKGPNPRTQWIARVAERVGRPLKLVPTRDQGFTIATFRAETRHHVKLGAAANGQLQSLSHEGWEVTSRPSGYNVAGVESTARMYACPNIHTAVNVVHADRNTPGYMRAPPETPYMFALESALDELAHQLKMDPIELRRVNDTPWSASQAMNSAQARTRPSPWWRLAPSACRSRPSRCTWATATCRRSRSRAVPTMRHPQAWLSPKPVNSCGTRSRRRPSRTPAAPFAG